MSCCFPRTSSVAPNLHLLFLRSFSALKLDYISFLFWSASYKIFFKLYPFIYFNSFTNHWFVPPTTKVLGFMCYPSQWHLKYRQVHNPNKSLKVKCQILMKVSERDMLGKESFLDLLQMISSRAMSYGLRKYKTQLCGHSIISRQNTVYALKI